MAGGAMNTVLLAEEQALFRAAVSHALGLCDDLAVTGEAGSLDETLEQTSRLRPTVVLVDAALSRTDGLSTCARIKAMELPTRVLVLSDAPDHGVLRSALEDGADGYLSKRATLAELVTATRSVAAGQAFVPPEMLGVLLRGLIDRRREEDAVAARFGRLSRREKEVLRL